MTLEMFHTECKSCNKVVSSLWAQQDTHCQECGSAEVDIKRGKKLLYRNGKEVSDEQLIKIELELDRSYLNLGLGEKVYKILSSGLQGLTKKSLTGYSYNDLVNELALSLTVEELEFLKNSIEHAKQRVPESVVSSDPLL